MVFIEFFLITNVLSNPFLIQTYCTYILATYPKMFAFRLLSDEFAVQSNGTFAFQKSNHVGYAVSRWKTQTHMHVIHHSMPFEEFNTSLSAQILNDFPKPAPKLPVNRFSSVFWSPNDMIFALPSYMCYALPVSHFLPPSRPALFPGPSGRSLITVDRQSLLGSHQQSW